MSEESIPSFANYGYDMYLDADGLKSIEEEVKKLEHPQTFRRSSLSPNEAVMIRNYFAERGFTVESEERGSRINRLVDLEIFPKIEEKKKNA